MLFDKIFLIIMCAIVGLPFLFGIVWALIQRRREREKMAFHNMCMDCKKFGVSCNDTIGTEPAPECFVPKTSEECKQECRTCKNYIPHKGIYGIGYCKNVNGLSVTHCNFCDEYEKKEGNFLC